MSPTPLEKPATRGAGAIAVTGGKGGVGKSNLVINLAVALGRLGRQVLVVDGDLGLANLDVLLGLTPQRTVEHLVRGEATLEELLVDGPRGIRVLPAASGVPDLSKLDGVTRGRLLGSLAVGAEQADDVLIDTGAGLNDTTLALQLAASRVLVVTTPEPTSLVDAYATLKVLWSADPHKPADLVVNAAENDDEARLAHEQIARAARQFLGREPGALGAVYRDPKVGEAVRRQRALLELYPTSRAGQCYERIALELATGHGTTDPATEYWRRLIDVAAQEPPN